MRLVVIGAGLVVVAACGNDNVHHLSDGPVADSRLIDAPADAAIDGAPDATPPPHFDIYADPVNGLDTNPGTLAEPVLTLAHASAIATSGQVIGLLDGVFREGALPTGCDGRGIAIAPGLTLRAVHPRAASVGNITVAVATGSFAMVDVTIDGECTGISMSSTGSDATLALTGVQFINGGHLVLAGTVAATIDPGTIVGSMTTDVGFGFATLTQGAQLAIHGGTLDGGSATTQCNPPLFEIANTSQLALDGVTVKNFSGAGIVLAQQATAVLDDQTVFDHVAYVTGCAGGIVLNGDGGGGSTTALTMTDATIQNSPTVAIVLRSAATATLKLTNVTVTGVASGIRFLTAEGSSVSLDMVGSHVTNTTATAIDIEPSSASAVTATITNSTITGNAQGLAFATGPGSTIAIAGSTIQNTGTGITLGGGTAITATALGDTWTANQQAADAAGHYTDGTDVTTATGSGLNFVITNGSTLDL
jgi:hypothetical protein|nr:right-handed parallel beta-helix repeat-containing protein [Kofleriaceae bacterium]